ncbi:hypothetical protein DM01DRAFT_1339541 [Hesseltinella vesiculosa]|uniref:Homeodomain-like protein n=1 Tax=Hesseltinella vesiculosa TaxID=101127 RepID=A0A1X2G6W0_9FUNG|nr:hypothetical protein DM01DRAFT_1339541 [Hesseltinella vesiculosa]
MTLNRCYRKSAWEPWEDKLLLDYVETNGTQWTDLARHVLPQKTSEACKLRYYHSLNPSKVYGPLTSDEKQLLKKGHDLLGNQWAKIAETYLPHRSSNTLHQAWLNSVNPNLSHCYARWTDEEDRTLRLAVDTLGKRWTAIHKQFLPHRRPGVIRTRYTETLDDSVKRTPWSMDELDVLLHRTIRLGTRNWAQIADPVELPGRTSVQCRSVYDRLLHPHRQHSTHPWKPSDERRFWDLVHAYSLNNEGEFWPRMADSLGRAGWECQQYWMRQIRQWRPLLGDQVMELQGQETRAQWRHRISNLVLDAYRDGVQAELDSNNSLTITTFASRRKDKKNPDLLPPKKQQRWSDSERKIFLKLVEPQLTSADWTQSGGARKVDWPAVAQSLTDAGYPRTRHQCYNYYHNTAKFHLDPSIEGKAALRDDEIQLLIQGIDMFGTNWQAIATTYLPHRRPTQLGHWYRHHYKLQQAFASSSTNSLIPEGIDRDQLMPMSRGWSDEDIQQLLLIVPHCKKLSSPDDTPATTSTIAHTLMHTDWQRVARMLGGHLSSVSCIQQWQLQHIPEGTMSNRSWTAAEKINLKDIAQKYEAQDPRLPFWAFWQCIAEDLGTGRSPYACRNKYKEVTASGSLFS